MVVNGTTYHEETPIELVEILENIRRSGMRCKFHYGDPKTGRPWGDIEVGLLDRSKGPRKVPITLYHCKCKGGPALLDHRIIKIQKARGGATVYDVNGKRMN